MRKIRIEPRFNWKQKVEDYGLCFHTTEGRPYWDESAYYEFTESEIDMLEEATAELQDMCMTAAQYIIDYDLFAELRIPPAAVPVIKRSWAEREPSLYGRFDLAYDGINPPKLLEYNADTPTALLEAGVAQWEWMREIFPSADQFNSIHDKLVIRWAEMRNRLFDGPLYFCHLDNDEDTVTTAYLRETAHQAGIRETTFLLMPEIGWNEETNSFRDLEEELMSNVFKLYPWEWLLEEFPAKLLDTYFHMRWIEPIWKMLWSNKGLLAVLWRIFPRHRLLLETYIGTPHTMEHYVKKPIFSREGANVIIHTSRGEFGTGGEYGAEGHVFQELAPLRDFGGGYPVIGSWVVFGQEPAGIGIRESDGPITDNRSRFVPHLFNPTGSFI